MGRVVSDGSFKMIMKLNFVSKLTTKQKEYLELVSRVAPKFLNVFRSCFMGGGGRKNAIQAACLDCEQFDTKAIRECSVSECGLHKYRPYQKTRS